MDIVIFKSQSFESKVIYTLTRGHDLRLVFSVRASRMCNSLLKAVVAGGSFEIFKRRLDDNLNEHNMRGYVQVSCARLHKC